MPVPAARLGSEGSASDFDFIGVGEPGSRVEPVLSAVDPAGLQDPEEASVVDDVDVVCLDGPLRIDGHPLTDPMDEPGIVEILNDVLVALALASEGDDSASLPGALTDQVGEDPLGEPVRNTAFLVPQESPWSPRS